MLMDVIAHLTQNALLVYAQAMYAPLIALLLQQLVIMQILTVRVHRTQNAHQDIVILLLIFANRHVIQLNSQHIKLDVIALQIANAGLANASSMYVFLTVTPLWLYQLMITLATVRVILTVLLATALQIIIANLLVLTLRPQDLMMMGVTVNKMLSVDLVHVEITSVNQTVI
jgi:hypothetical protein